LVSDTFTAFSHVAQRREYLLEFTEVPTDTGTADTPILFLGGPRLNSPLGAVIVRVFRDFLLTQQVNSEKMPLKLAHARNDMYFTVTLRVDIT
jgi:hypothetical protein